MWASELHRDTQKRVKHQRDPVCSAPVGCRGALLPHIPTRLGRFPFPREKGSEKGSQKMWEGRAEKTDFLRKSG